MTKRISLAAAGICGALLLSLLTGAPAGPANDFHFAIVGDRAGSPEPTIYGRVWREVDLLRPDFVMNVGDSIQGGDDAAAEKQWEEFRAIREKYGRYPFFMTPGNHDVWSDLSKRLYERESGHPLHYSFDHGGMHVTVLDNSRGEVALSVGELQFLEQDLAANAAKHPKLVVFHKPYWIEALQAGGDFPLHNLAKKYGVDYVVSGHGHRFAHMSRDGVRYMEVGSSGGSMRGKLVRGEGFSQGSFYHFVWAHVAGSTVRFVVKELPPPAGMGRMFPAEDWDEKGPRFDLDDPALKDKPRT
ncbi:MAG: metallophosphoesterase [Acidobacteria bacterium]|nr:metallophosphoesterase [Acidobacteriota bacterium]